MTGRNLVRDARGQFFSLAVIICISLNRSAGGPLSYRTVIFRT